MILFELSWVDLIWSDVIHCDLIWCDWMWCDLIWCGVSMEFILYARERWRIGEKETRPYNYNHSMIFSCLHKYNSTILQLMFFYHQQSTQVWQRMCVNTGPRSYILTLIVSNYKSHLFDQLTNGCWVTIATLTDTNMHTSPGFSDRTALPEGYTGNWYWYCDRFSCKYSYWHECKNQCEHKYKCYYVC